MVLGDGGAVEAGTIVNVLHFGQVKGSRYGNKSSIKVGSVR